MSLGCGVRRWVFGALYFIVVLALLSPVAACGALTAEQPERDEGKTVVSGTSSDVDTTVGATSGTVSDGEAEAAGGDDEFVSDGAASGGSGRAADAILGVRFGQHEGYERLVVDLGVGDEPAGAVPRWTLRRSPGDGLLRVDLPSVRNTAVSDGNLGEAGASILDGFCVVRAPEDGLFVDVLAGEEFEYRTMELEDPARLVVDFRAADGELEVPPPKAAFNTVLVEPRSGAEVGGALTVSGYSRNPEAMNTIFLEGPAGKILARKSVLGNDWTSTWGYFEATLDIPSFTGEGKLRVGAASARDGEFEGVEIPVVRD